MTRRHGRLGAGVGLLAGLVILGPALAPGYVWLYDMVFVPHLALSDHTLGIDGTVPRAVPTDAVVAVLSTVLPGSLVQKLLLLGIFVVAGAGAARFCGSRLGAATAALAMCWNPFVAERLVIGHWAFLIGFANLPWIFAAVADWRRGDDRGVRPLLPWLVVAAVAGSTAAVVATLVALVALLVPPGPWDLRTRVRNAAGVLALMLLLSACWIVPSLRLPGGVPADPNGVGAFAAHADSPLGLWPSLLTLGGIWHEPSWPDSRTGGPVGVAFALVVLVVVVVAASRWGILRAVAPLAVAGLLGLAIAGMTSLPGGDAVARAIVTGVPGGGIVRDSQKFVMVLVVLVAVLAGLVVDRLAAVASRGGVLRWVATVSSIGLLLAPVAALPDAAWGVADRLRADPVPAEVTATRDFFATAPDGAVAVFPWTLYRRVTSGHGQVALDPWNRLLERRVLVNDDLPLSDRTIAGEDPLAREVGEAIGAGGPALADVARTRGIRWAVLLGDQTDAAASRRLLLAAGFTRVSAHGDIEVYDSGVAAGARTSSTSALPLAVSLLTALGCLAPAVSRRAASAVVPARRRTP
ncbi:MAG: hypothetical protein ABW004_15425 [Aeromicrobium sp.]